MTERNVILLGGPGAGKGTQAERIVADFELPHVSTGEMLRAAVAKGTEMGLEAQKYMESGALVPDEVVIGVVRERLAEPDAGEGFLLDGFPRTVPRPRRSTPCSPRRQGDHARRAHRRAGRRARAAHRRPPLVRVCGKIYNVAFDPPKADGVCDLDGGELTQRADDNEETVRNRIAVYEQQTAPLVGYYRQGRARERVRRRQAAGRSVRAGPRILAG